MTRPYIHGPLHLDQEFSGELRFSDQPRASRSEVVRALVYVVVLVGGSVAAALIWGKP